MASKDPFSLSAKFEDVINVKDALKFHMDRYNAGHRDTLAKHCFQYFELNKHRDSK